MIMVTMKSGTRFSTVLLGILLISVPASAVGLYTVTLTNGNTLEVRYKPKPAPWDESLLLLRTDVGNNIAFRQDDVESVVSDIDLTGRGRALSATTVQLGFAANDAAAPSDAPIDPQTALLNLLTSQANQPAENYSVEQFVDPSKAQGIPKGFQ